MRLLIQLPDFIEDTILLTPSIENIFKKFRDSQITLLGSKVSTQLFINDKRIYNLIVDGTNESLFKPLATYNLSKELGEHDLTMCFKESFCSKLLTFCSKCEKKSFYKNPMETNIHQVLKYNNFINESLELDSIPGELMLKFKPQWFKKPTFGIHPGSTYGSTKRWDAKEFAKVAIELSSKYDILILGGKNEIDIAEDIEKELINADITNYKNLAGKTTIPDLVEKIAALDIFLTIDSGPMHIASVYKVNTYIVPTSNMENKTPWKNPLETIISKKEDLYEDEENIINTISAEDVLEVIWP